MTKRTYSIDAPDQARLKVARAEIEAVMRKHDLAGAVVLHTPGMAEFFYDIRPSYSCIFVDGQMLRVRSKAADYGGDRQAQLHDQAATANMTNVLAGELRHAAAMFREIDLVASSAARAEHTAAEFVPDANEAKRH